VSVSYFYAIATVWIYNLCNRLIHFTWFRLTFVFPITHLKIHSRTKSVTIKCKSRYATIGVLPVIPGHVFRVFRPCCIMTVYIIKRDYDSIRFVILWPLAKYNCKKLQTINVITCNLWYIHIHDDYYQKYSYIWTVLTCSSHGC